MPISYKHLGFTGTKEEMTDAQHLLLLSRLSILRDDGFLWMHNGDCKGSDYKAGVIWQRLKGKLYLHPPLKKKYRAFMTSAHIICEPKAYLKRDEDIAESCHTLVATPLTEREELRSGTWSTIRYARKLRRRIYIIRPDGIEEIEE